MYWQGPGPKLSDLNPKPLNSKPEAQSLTAKPQEKTPLEKASGHKPHLKCPWVCFACVRVCVRLRESVEIRKQILVHTFELILLRSL